MQTSEGRWVVPPQRAVWVLPGISHRVSSKTSFWLRTLYVEPQLTPLPSTCCVVGVDRLVQELFIAASEFGPAYEPRGREARLMRVILDRLPQLTASPLHLPSPADPRLKRLTQGLLRILPMDEPCRCWPRSAG